MNENIEVLGRCLVSGTIVASLIALAMINDKLNFGFGIIISIIFIGFIIWSANVDCTK